MKRKDIFARAADANGKGNLRFVSTNTLEKELDGSESTFNDYFFAIYRCSPRDNAGIKELREQISNEYPNNAMSVGDDFVLIGEAAYLSLSTYYKALIKSSDIREEFRKYFEERLEQITTKHHQSQSLPVPVNLTEGQLSYDERVELLTSIALNYGQVIAVEKD
jgi:hypothetical protein